MSEDEGGFSQEEQDASDLCYALALNIREGAGELLDEVKDAPIAGAVRAVVDAAIAAMSSIESGTAGEALRGVEKLQPAIDQLASEAYADDQPANEYQSIVDEFVDMYDELLDAAEKYRDLMEG